MSVAQSGLTQRRTTTQVARTWEETYTPLKANSDPIAREFLETLANLYRNQTPFTVAHVGQLALLGAGGGTPVVAGSGQTGYLLVTNGWAASTAVLKAGDVFTIAGLPWVYDVTEDVTSDGSGNATIPLNPPLLGNTATSSPVTGAAITINSTPGAVTYTAMIDSLDMPQAGGGPGYYQGCRVGFREVRGTRPVVVAPGLAVVPTGQYLEGTIAALAGGGAGLGVLAIKLRFLVDAISQLPPNSAVALFDVDYDHLMQPVTPHTSLVVYVTTDGSGNYTLTVGSGFGPNATYTAALSSLPAPGTLVVCYAFYSEVAPSGNSFQPIVIEVNAELFDDVGDIFGTADFSEFDSPVFPTPPGSTSLYIGAAPDIGTLQPEGGLTVDWCALYTVLLTGAARYSAPASTDAGIIGLYGFSGSLASTAGLGGTLAPFTMVTDVKLPGAPVTYLPGGEVVI
jgi:hypothetical protein